MERVESPYSRRQTIVSPILILANFRLYGTFAAKEVYSAAFCSGISVALQVMA